MCQFIHRLLFGPKDLVCGPLAHMVLQQVRGLGLQDSLFLMQDSQVQTHVKERAVQSEFIHWLLQEPVVYGRRLTTGLRF